MLWVISFNLFNFVATWTGINTISSVKKKPAKQLVCYLEPTHFCKTRKDLAKETMHQSRVVAEECG